MRALKVSPPPKPALRKVTVMLPADLVDRALQASKVGLTPTIRRGLEAVAATEAYHWIRQHRGKLKLSINVDELRED